MIRAFILLFVVVVLPTNVMAQESRSPELINSTLALGLITYIKIDDNDGVTDNCWTNAANITANIRLKLEQNDVEVLKYEPAFLSQYSPQLFLGAYGLRTTGGLCVASATLKVVYVYYAPQTRAAPNSVHYILSGSSVPFETSSIITNGGNLNRQLATFFDTASSELIADILSARRNALVKQFKQDLPHLAKKPPSMDELEKKLKDSK